ncbi:hypothetical protein Cgig2_018894 [Carnegiea gigantea]|uniref:RING-type E3 ubiquitin transferase n=1 Tax=Carnegiea gigantea TaxID=171969 RepID=A0A9Q1K901_9CARY|nr:hypothetical protein Cgig2_018894 [Carnegiea gigantea]
MGTLGNPKIWVPYINPKDCSQGFCSLSCPQWCYLILPPPPPPSSSSSFPLDTSSSSPTFSPLVITIIGVLASAFLLVSYYAILSKYCGNSESSRGVENQQPSLDEDGEESDHHDTTNEHEPWVIRTLGLDEALIKSITLVKSHTNCPLCRANVFCTTTQPPPAPPLVVGNNNHHQHPPQAHQPSTQTQVANEQNRSGDQEEDNSRNIPKSLFQASSDLGLHGEVQGYTMRRSISMDHCHETRLSISEALRFDSKEAAAGESSKSTDGGGGSSNFSNEISGNGVSNCVIDSVAMKRSFSSGRFLFMTKHSRGRNAIIPL